MMRFVALILFFPTLWWNKILNRVIGKHRRWWDWVDDDVLLGALPEAEHLPALKSAGIRAVINTCCEFEGHMPDYALEGVEALCLPTVDYTPPTMESIRQGIDFMHRHIAQGHKIYVHCKAGRGRSATLVMCYLIANGMTPEQAQAHLLSKRPHVLPTLYRRDVVQQFYNEIKSAPRRTTRERASTSKTAAATRSPSPPA